MWIFCALLGLFQLIILLMLSGLLFSVAAISRLMEITVILIYPTVVFLLRQSANLIILLTILTAKMTSSAFRKLYTLAKCDQLEVVAQQEPSLAISPVKLNMQTPILQYKKTVLEEIPKYILQDGICIFVEDPDVASLANERIIEPLQEDDNPVPSQDDNPIPSQDDDPMPSQDDNPIPLQDDNLTKKTSSFKDMNEDSK